MVPHGLCSQSPVSKLVVHRTVQINPKFLKSKSTVPNAHDRYLVWELYPVLTSPITANALGNGIEPSSPDEMLDSPNAIKSESGAARVPVPIKLQETRAEYCSLGQ